MLLMTSWVMLLLSAMDLNHRPEAPHFSKPASSWHFCLWTIKGLCDLVHSSSCIQPTRPLSLLDLSQFNFPGLAGGTVFMGERFASASIQEQPGPDLSLCAGFANHPLFYLSPTWKHLCLHLTDNIPFKPPVCVKCLKPQR